MESTLSNAMSEQPTIAFSLPDGNRLGGVTRWSHLIAENIAAQGGKTALLHHPYHHRDVIPNSSGDAVPTIPCGANSLHKLSAASVKAYRSAAPAVFIPNYTDGPYATCAAIAAENPEDLRIIGYCHTFEDRYFEWLVHYEPIIHRFVAVSQHCINELKRLMPHRADDMTVMHYAVSAPEKLTRTWSPPDQPIQLLFAGRIVERQKRAMLLIDLAQMLHELKVDFHLRIVGDGPQFFTMKRKIASLPAELSNRLELLPSVAADEMTALQEASDCCVLVSEYEGFSIFMSEAMARGTVPVVTDVSGSGDIIRSGENGFLAPVDDISQLATAIQTLANDRTRLEETGRAAFESGQTLPSATQYAAWLQQFADDCWKNDPPRKWPAERPLFQLHKYFFFRAASLLPTWDSLWGN